MILFSIFFVFLLSPFEFQYLKSVEWTRKKIFRVNNNSVLFHPHLEWKKKNRFCCCYIWNFIMFSWILLGSFKLNAYYIHFMLHGTAFITFYPNVYRIFDGNNVIQCWIWIHIHKPFSIFLKILVSSRQNEHITHSTSTVIHMHTLSRETWRQALYLFWQFFVVM